ncbi:unnamed protein product [[Actinomadura] parvosata subsp. kistnae]|uniref:Uncharacterized protein n=1 Tax=Nonomuraea composti TaxID=2720023 RepID=A0ABX1BHF4_9ACTN|nr:hypothetical protein [Nonomuraea sp. FMUSA5-5]NJP96005.1 hypothetical protein [Nonomuraea sp. FMUSA5-5]SPL88321.1 unnamed protein product [Actinomadura parvosata subsp. kistnae]
MSLLLVLPSAVNLICGLTWIWTPALPLPLLDLLARAGLLDAWLVVDLLTAAGGLGAAGVAALAGRERAAGTLILAAVSVISFAAAAAGGGWLPASYGLAYGVALVPLRRM